MRISDWSSDMCSSDLFTAAEVDSIADGLRYRPLRSRLIASARARLGSVRRKLLTTPHDGEPHGIQRPGVAGVTEVVLTYHRPDGLNALRLEARRVGKACGSTCRSRWSRYT